MPSLVERVKSWLFRNAPAPRASGFTRDPKTFGIKFLGYQLVTGGGGRDNFETSKTDLTILANAIEKDSYLAQAVMRYAELLFVSGWTFKGKNEQALLYLKQRLEMIAVATKTPTEDLFFGIGHDIVRYANCFLVKARAKGGKGLPPGMTLTPILPSKDAIAGYFRLPPQTMTISRDVNGNVLAYRQTPISGGENIDFKPEDVVHISVNRPVGEAYGESFISPVIEDIRLLRKIEENAALFLYRHIFPLMKYKVGLPEKGMEATPEEIESLKNVIENLPTDGALLMPERHNLESIPIDTVDVRPFLDYFENRVFTGLGMSQVDFGRGDTANRNTADAMTGNKADRVKGWQQQIQVQIDKFIIEELLIEGGYDPLINPDFDINFSFNEVQQEQRIKHDVHEIFKFTNNVQTWDETRKNLGMDPVTDESRLYVNMIGSMEQATSAQASNLNQPSNQFGTRSGPKRSTEMNEKEMIRLDTEEIIRLFQSFKNAFVTEFEKYQKEKGLSPIWLSLLPFQNEFQSIIGALASDQFLQGAKQASTDFQLMKSAEMQGALRIHIKQASLLLMDHIQHKLKQIDVLKADASQLWNGFEMQLKKFVRTELIRSYNVGYAAQIKKYGVSHSSVMLSAASCKTCSNQSKEGHAFVIDSLWDDFALLERIPPYHANCECTLKKGGESNG